MTAHKKNGRVELLRFLFSLSILFFHIQKRFAGDAGVPIGSFGDNRQIFFFIHGYIGVEFFFLVSGYLLAASCFSKREVPVREIGTETAEMMWRKIAFIFPYHLFAMALTIGVNAFFLESSAYDRLLYVIDSWPSIFFVQVFGFDSTWANKLTWYLGVWLAVSFLYYPILRKYYDVFAKIACPLLALFILGYLSHEYDSLAMIEGWTGLFYRCFLRGLAEMALGVSAFSLTRYVKRLAFNRYQRFILALVEMLGYVSAFWFAMRDVTTEYGFAALFLMTVSLILTFSEINPLHRLFDLGVFSTLGPLSLLLYLNQFYSIRLVEYLAPEEMAFSEKTVLCVLLTFAGSFTCYAFVRMCKTAGKKAAREA